jgi:type II secretion system protein J
MKLIPSHRLSQSLQKQQGMTLLEVLVATGILAVISSMAFVSLDTLIKSKQSLQAASSELNQFNLAQFQLQNDIQMAVASNHPSPTLVAPEFIADSQTFTLLRYRKAIVPNQRAKRSNNQSSGHSVNNQNLIRVRWYVRNQQWVRATQAAASPLNSNQWQERPMLALKSLSCNYQNIAGTAQSNWPDNQIQNSQLPEMITCQVQLENDQESILKLVPWQRAGWF